MMSQRKLSLCLLALSLTGLYFLAPSALADDEKSKSTVFEMFDVSDLLAVPAGGMAPLLGLPAPYWSTEHPKWRGSVDDEAFRKHRRPFMDDGQLVHYIMTLVEPRSWETNEFASIEVRGGELLVRNSKAIITKVRERLTLLRAHAARRVTLKLAVKESQPDQFPDVGSENATDHSGFLELVPYAMGALVQTRQTTFVADYEVEIAQGSNLSNPTMRNALGGFVAELVASPTLDGDRILVEGIIQHGRVVKDRSAPTGTDEEYLPRPHYRSDTRTSNGEIELPTYHGVTIVMSAVVPSGGSVPIPVAVHGRQTTVIVQPKVAPPPTASSLIPLGVLTRRDFGQRVLLRPLAGSYSQGRWMISDAPEITFADDSDERVRHPDDVLELIRSQVHAWVWQQKGWCELVGPHRMIVVAEPKVDADVRDFIRARERQALRSVNVDVRVYTTESSIQSGAGEQAPRDGELLAAGRIPTVFGRRGGLMAGSTSNFVMDYDVEVAQEARIGDPLVSQAFDGLVFDVVPRNAEGSRTVSLDVDLSFAQSTISRDRFDTGTLYLGPIDEVKITKRVVDSTIQVPIDGTYVIDAGRLSKDSPQRVAIEIRLSR